jgi:hypothetical protein
MKRIHLFEIEDQAWCPNIIRESITDFLYGLYRLLPIYQPAYEKIATILNITGEKMIIDCCSGSGGPIVQLRSYLDSCEMKDVAITLTDKYPNLAQFKQLEMTYGTRLTGHKDSVDACQLPTNLKGLRCFFSSFHHFVPSQAVKILQDAVNNNAPIAIFESTSRHAVDMIRALFSPVLMLLITPYAKRLTWRKFLITYLIPVAPFAFMWDYLVSNLRTYSRRELEQLVNQLNAPTYRWEIGKLSAKKNKGHVPYLIGYPADSQLVKPLNS